MDTHMGLRVMLSSFGGTRNARTPMGALEHTRYTVCDCYSVSFACPSTSIDQIMQ